MSINLTVFLVNLGTALVLFLLFAYGNEYVTDFVKNISRALLVRVPWLGTVVSSKYYGLVLAGMLAYWVASSFGVDFLTQFKTLENLDPDVIVWLNAILMALGANKVHDGEIKLSNG